MSITTNPAREFHDAYMQHARKATLEQLQIAGELLQAAGLRVENLPAVIIALSNNYQSAVIANHS